MLLNSGVHAAVLAPHSARVCVFPDEVHGSLCRITVHSKISSRVCAPICSNRNQLETYAQESTVVLYPSPSAVTFDDDSFDLSSLRTVIVVDAKWTKAVCWSFYQYLPTTLRLCACSLLFRVVLCSTPILLICVTFGSRTPLATLISGTFVQ